MPINIGIDLSARRRQREALEQLEKQRQATQAITGQLFGIPTEGPPTAAGLQSRIGGVLPGGIQADIAETQLTSGVPAMQQAGFTSAQSILEQQRQQQLAEQQRSQLEQALQSQAIQATPEGQAIASLLGAGATKEQIAAIAPQLAPFTLGTGQQRFGGAGGTIAIAPEKAEDLRAKQAQLFGQATTLRKEFTGATKEYAGQNAAYGRVIASAEDPSAAGDLALIFNFMKVLDPGSTVREGEFATAQNAAGVDQRIMALYNKVITGQRLTVPQRTDFVDRAGKLFESASEQHKKTAEEFRNLAKRQNIDPANVVFQRQLIEPQQGMAPPPPPGFK